MNESSILTGILSWIVPGAGHVKAGYWKRGVVVGAVVWTLFVVGVYGSGFVYPSHSFDDGRLVYLLDIFARFGNGPGFLLSLIFGSLQARVPVELATYEYSQRLLEISGLVNYLAAMDAIDLALKRKR